VLQIGVLVSTLGDGMAITFLLIYLHNVRGLSLGAAGAVLATTGLGAVVAAPLAGPVIDRLGPRPSYATSLATSACGYGVYPFVHRPWQAFVAAAVVGAGRGSFGPSHSAFLGSLVPAHKRHAVFGFNYMVVNIGAGVGGVVGGLLLASAAGTSGYTRLFLADAASFLFFLAVTLFVRPGNLRRDRPAAALGYRHVLVDAVFLRFVVLNFVFFAAGLAVSELVAVYAQNEAGVGPGWIGVIYAFNAIAIISFQLPVAKLIEGRRRAAGLAVMSAIWAASWLLVLGGGLWLRSTSAAVVFSLALALFGLGECIHSSIHGALAVDLAPVEARGRYLAVSSLAVPLALVTGPAAGGLLLAAWPHLLWPIAAGACLVAGWAVLRLGLVLPDHVRLTPKGGR
jgi:MFS family permease